MDLAPFGDAECTAARPPLASASMRAGKRFFRKLRASRRPGLPFLLASGRAFTLGAAQEIVQTVQ
jgi:hypothetical protein